jgi:APA family basic amino acid/polyamine antiporter
MLGVLVNLILGLSRVVLAMARRGDAPRWLARIGGSQASPYFAVGLVGAAIAGLALIGDVKTTWSFSAFTVLVYYAITNLAALRLDERQRLYPRPFAWLGLVACLFLAFWVPWRIWAVGLGFIGLGLIWHTIAVKWGPARP